MATVVHEHPKHGRLELVADADTLTQGQLERFMDEYQKLEGKFTPYGKIVRAALSAGWVLDPAIKAEDVPTKTSKWTSWAGKLLDDLYTEATQADPKVSAPLPPTPKA